MDLDGNPLTALPASFANLTTLNYLSLNATQMTAYPPELHNLPGLRRIGFGGYGLGYIPQPLLDNPTLTVVNMYGNNLTSLPQEITNWTNLYEFYLGDNQLDEDDFPAWFGSFPTLRYLGIDKNKLKTVPLSLFDLVNLGWIDLRNNIICCYPTQMSAWCNKDPQWFAGNYANFEEFCLDGSWTCTTNDPCLDQEICEQLDVSMISPETPICAGSIIDLQIDNATNLPPGATIEWYVGSSAGFDLAEGGLLACIPVPDQAPAAYQGPVKINEIMVNSGPNCETAKGLFIELVGTPGTDIGCWVLSDGAQASDDFVITIPPGTTIPPDGFFLIALNDPNGCITGVDIDLDLGNSDYDLSNEGEYLVLFNDQGVLTDAVSWGPNPTDQNDILPQGHTIDRDPNIGCDPATFSIPTPADAPNIWKETGLNMALYDNFSLHRAPDGGNWAINLQDEGGTPKATNLGADHLAFPLTVKYCITQQDCDGGSVHFRAAVHPTAEPCESLELSLSLNCTSCDPPLNVPANATHVEHLNVNEFHIYGSSRLGICNIDSTLEMQAFESQGVNADGTLMQSNPSTVSQPQDDPDKGYARILGKVFYELSDHRGNVNVVVSDRKLLTSADDPTDATFVADVRRATDFYPFGMEMTERYFTLSSYRYYFNGKEKDSENKKSDNFHDYGFRIYDPHLGRFLSVDPLSAEYPWYTPYQFAGNTPIKFVDIEGLEPGIDESFTGYKTGTHLAMANRTIAGRISRYLREKRNLTGDEFLKEFNRWFSTNMGHVFEEAVLKSYGVRKNETRSFNGRIPDGVEESSINFPPIKRVVYPNSTFIEAKFKRIVLKYDENYKTQLQDMINYLATKVRKHERVAKRSLAWYPRNTGSATDEGLAVLLLLTPENTIIDKDLIKFAEDRKVKIYQMKLYKNPENDEFVRLGFPIPKTSPSEFLNSKYKSFGIPRQVKMNWDLPLIDPDTGEKVEDE